MLGTKPRMQFACNMDPERFPPVPKVPPFEDPFVTGREVEQIWKNAGKPSISMEFDELTSVELLGRVVKIHVSHAIEPSFSYIEAVTHISFMLHNNGVEFSVGTGSAIKALGMERTYCELTTRAEWDEHANKMKAVRERNKLVNAIIDLVQRKDSLAPTMEQLQAAANAMGLVKD